MTGGVIATKAVCGLLGLTAILFVASVAWCLNGSSSSSYHYTRGRDIHLNDAPEGLLLSTPKGIRSDEFMVVTPAMLSQARSHPAFPVSNASYGVGKVPLIMGLPARHYTMIFRPGLWGFFVLGFEWGFSWYWNLKIFGLFTALFLLFWTLTGGRFGPSLAGAILVQYSGFTQWWFSSPAMLPEMLTAWAGGTLAGLCLFSVASTYRRVLCALLVAFSLTAFVLCCYPPFAIPLLYLSVVVVMGRALETRLPLGPGFLWAGAGCLGAAVILTPWFVECRETLGLVAHTAYPGQRVTLGGGLSPARLFSGLFGFGLTEANTPASLLNVCEAANFFPIWWVPIGMSVVLSGRRMVKKRTGDTATVRQSVQRELGTWLLQRALAVLLTLYIVLLTWYALVGLPQWLCTLTLLGRCTEQRCLLPIGVAGVILTVLAVLARPAEIPSSRRTERIVVLATWSVVVAAFLLFCRPQMPAFLVPWRLVLFEGIAIVLAGVYLRAPSAWFLILLPALLLWHHGLINPVCRGLPELTQSTALQFVRAMVQADPAAAWASFDNLSASEMIKACGGHVINGLRVVPDLPLVHQLDPGSQSEFAYNRFAHIIFEPLEFDRDPKFTLQQNIYCIIEVHPRRLARLYPDLRYVVCTHPLHAWREEGLEPMGVDLSNANLWIYRVVRDGDPLAVPGKT